MRLENKLPVKEEWFVDFFEVHDFHTSTKKVFPCYHWIRNNDSNLQPVSTLVIAIDIHPTYTACYYRIYTAFQTFSLIFLDLLKAVESNRVIVRHRELQLAQCRQRYPWMKIEDLCLPSAIDSSVDLPPDEGFELTKNVQFYSQALVDTADTALTGARSEVHSLSGYEEHAELLGKPEFPVYQLGRWTSDVEFGRQILNGVNPVVICMCKSLPGKFP